MCKTIRSSDLAIIHCNILLLHEWYLGIADDDSVGGLKLGGYEKHQEKLRQERKEEYRKYLAEVRT